MARIQYVLASLVAVGVTIVGCGSTDNSEFGEGGSSAATGAGSSGQLGGASSSGSSGTPQDPNSVGNVGNVSANDACATSNAGTALEPISLVFMIDRSGSMGNTNQGSNLAVRWTPVKDGLTTFFGDPASTNLEASLAFFPILSSKNSVCTSSSYQSPVVAMTALPNAAPFSTAFTNTGPNGGTPTEPALQGALDYAASVKAGGKKVAVVLATDGEPNDCDSSASGVASIATTGANAGIKTYVIGVGPSTGNLDTIAAGGGTSKAIMIPTNNPAQVSSDLIKAVGNIASSLLGCDYQLPTPPAGQTLDVNKVNVNFTAPNQPTKTLAYSSDCSNPDGWHYDSTTAPTKIVLCQKACDTGKNTPGAKLDVIFGCQIAAPPGETLPGPK